MLEQLQRAALRARDQAEDVCDDIKVEGGTRAGSNIRDIPFHCQLIAKYKTSMFAKNLC